MDRHVGQLQDFLAMQSIALAPTTADIAIQAGLLNWSHRDPFDRLIAATALVMGMDLISADTAFDSLPGLRRVW